MAEAGGTEVAPAPRILRITSGCATRESFVAYFRAFCQDESIFIATKTPKPTGDRVRVSIALSTGTPLIVGGGVIGESYGTAENPFKRPGMRIHFDELSPESRALFGEMGATREEQATIKAPNLAALMAAAAVPPPPREPTPARPVPPLVVPRPKSDTDVAVPGADGAAEMVADAEGQSRAPGSSFILPANPLSELDPDQLFAFVECTMVEEEEDQPAGQLGEEGRRASRDTEPAALGSGTETERGFAPAAVDAPVPMPVPMQFTVPAPVAQTPPGDRKRLLLIGAVAGALPALLAGVLIGRSMRPEPSTQIGSPSPSPSPDPIPSPSPDPSPSPSTEHDTRSENSSEPSRSEGAVNTSTEDCKLRVTSEPDGATVKLGDRRLGDTPLEAALPCGTHEIQIRRTRYADVTRKVELTAARTAKVDVKLERPEYNLRVEATPRAMVTIDGKSAGLSPVSVKVLGHTPIDVSVALTGYQPWSKQVKLSKNTRLDARLALIKLAPVPKPKPTPKPRP
ncbi:MAG TPA: PEGA domain-containing protein [Kofleriaceae bacterium]|nr:PEGA domain-containing protein [Kofleriaceae bacterium]